jgi:hypothetical protein
MNSDKRKDQEMKKRNFHEIRKKVKAVNCIICSHDQPFGTMVWRLTVCRSLVCYIFQEVKVKLNKSSCSTAQ